jgi:hypothetical protein
MCGYCCGARRVRLAEASGREFIITVPADPFRLAAAVYGILRNKERILLIRRGATGYSDGHP